MKCLLSAFLTGFSVLDFAIAGTWQPLPAPEFADTEVSTNVAMRTWDGLLRKFNFSLEFDATPSNNVQIAFGTDADTNGMLSAEETRMPIDFLRFTERL